MIQIQSNSGNYTAQESPSLVAALSAHPSLAKCFVIMDSQFSRLTEPAALALLADRPTLLIEANEPNKSFEKISPLLSQLLEMGFRRDCELLAIGGGVVQDITCFMASILMRGVPWDFIPTTLLAQCDSCIGSKSSINIGRFKNQIGTFYSPRNVTLVPEVLRTLPADDIRSGLGEAIKLHLIAGTDSFQWLKERLARMPLDPEALSTIVQSSLAIKKPFIEADEFDRGIRNLLNYGHTFGHAYETATDFQIPHGIAVTLGVATATYVSEQLALTPPGHFQEIATFLKPWHQPYGELLKSGDLERVRGAIKLDKKNTDGEINCILTRGFGQMEKRKVTPEVLWPLLEAFLREEL